MGVEKVYREGGVESISTITGTVVTSQVESNCKWNNG